MDKKNEYFLMSFAPLPGLFVGIRDALNPYALTSFLIYALILLYMSSRAGEALKIGTSFIVSFASMSFLCQAGLLDKFLEQGWVNNTIFLINWIFAGMLIIAGVLFLFDWARVKFKGDQIGSFTKMPYCLELKKNEREIFSESKKVFGLKIRSCIVFPFAMGVFAVMNNTTWAPSSDLYYAVIEAMSAGDLIEAIVAFIFYGIGMAFPMILLLLLVLLLCSRKKHFVRSVNAVSFTRIIFSAVFLSAGAGLVYIMLG